jgi:Cys-rich protein (TIGR01571 family)
MSLLGKWPEFSCVVMQSWFTQARMFHRIGRFSVLRIVLLALLQLSVSVGFLVLSALTKSVFLKLLYAVLSGTVSSLNIVANAYSLWVRYTVRKTLGIYGSVAEDCSILICCSPCSLVQMDQKTEPIKHISTGAEKDLIAGSLDQSTSSDAGQKQNVHSITRAPSALLFEPSKEGMNNTV